MGRIDMRAWAMHAREAEGAADEDDDRAGPRKPCSCCGVDFQLRHWDGCFFAICSRCGRQGPVASSAYGAMMAWRRQIGLSAPSAGRQLLTIVSILVLLAGSLLTLAALAA
jgi:hypothetical protein